MRVLSIDGGGIRGIIPATVLAALEQRAGRPVSELFDLIAGTSTGGILSLALTVPDPRDDTRPRWRAEELVALYVEEGPKIFDRSLLRIIRSVDGLLDERYDNEALRDALERYIGPALMADARTPTLIPTYDLERPGPRFFKSWREDSRDVPMALVAEATSAAPTYFEPVIVGGEALVDGGVFAANPAMSAYAEARRLLPADDDVLVVSLGTGEQTKPISGREARGWGQLEWARPIIDVVLDGQSDAVDYQLDQILATRHVRLQTELTIASGALDDASPKNLAALVAQGEALVRENAATLDALAAELAA